jgi:hypothetical protein
MKRITTIIILTVLYSCNSKENKNTIAKLKKANYKVKILQESVILKDSETCVKIIPMDSTFKTINAFVDCGKLEERESNLELNAIIGCDKNLLIENDTVKIYFTYNEIGDFKFGDLTLLIKENNGNLSFIDTTFWVKIQ